MRKIGELDAFDLKILASLAQEGRTNWGNLAERVGLSQSPTLRRVRALESGGFIAGYHAVIDEGRLGYGISVFVSVSLDSQTDEALGSFENHIRWDEHVMNCHMMTGTSDYLLRVVVADLPAFQSFISKLTRIPGVARVSSSFAVKSVVQRWAPPLSRPPLHRPPDGS